MRSTLHAHESARTPLFPHPSPWPEQPCGQLAAAAQPPAPSRRRPRLAASWPRCSTLRLSSSVYSFQIHSCCFLFGSLFCVMVFRLFFQSLPTTPLLSPVAGFLRRLVFGESCEHICSLSGSIPGGPRQGLGSQGARTRGAAEAGAHGSGPWQSRPVAGTSTAAGRAEPQGPWALPEPQSRGSPTPWPRWLWLLAPSAQVRVCQTWGGKESRGLRNDPGHCLLSSAAPRGEGPMCGRCGRPRGVWERTCVS